jgi:hypothetical protein
MIKGDEFAAVSRPGVELAERRDGDAVGGGEDDDLVGAEAHAIDRVGVDEVCVVAGGEDRRHQSGADELLHGRGDADVGGGEAGPGVVGGRRMATWLAGWPCRMRKLRRAM